MVTLLPSLWPCPDVKKISIHTPDRLSSCLNMSLSTYIVQASVAAMLVVLGVHMQTTTAQATAPTCVTIDQPNPIFSQYPNNATGVLNLTMAIIPIPMTTARQMIPPQYGILENALRAVMPDFPAGMYPVVVQAGHDHDIRFQEFQIPDFSVRSAWPTSRIGSQSANQLFTESWLRVSVLGPIGRRRFVFQMGPGANDLG